MFLAAQIDHGIVDEKRAEGENGGDEQNLKDDPADRGIAPRGGDAFGRRMMSVAIVPRFPRRAAYFQFSGSASHTSGPPRVHRLLSPALEFELGVLAESTVENLAVIPNQLDRVVGPFLVEARAPCPRLG